MPLIYHCRLVDYYQNTAVVRWLPADTGCLGSIDQMYGRHINGYEGVPVVATTTECCDVIPSTDDRQAVSCFPGGVSEKLRGHVVDLDNCFSMTGKTFDLLWTNEAPPSHCGCPPEPAEAWIGTLAMPGGTLTVYLCCIPPSDPDIFPWPTFQFCFDGCDSGLGAGTALYPCTTPFVLNSGNVDTPNCCKCQLAHTLNTAGINVVVVGNCMKVIWARHVGYQSDGTPIVARERICGYDRIDSCGCGIMTCGLYASITSSDCPCMEQSTWLDLSASGLPPGGGSLWTATTSGCGNVLQWSAQCGPVEDDPDSVNIFFQIVCGADNVGSGSVDIPCKDLDTLDVTIDVPMTWGGNPHCEYHQCEWIYIEMAVSWVQVSSCPDDCTCQEPDSPGADQEHRFTSCNSTVTPCCEGALAVRIQRDGGGMGPFAGSLPVKPAPARSLVNRPVARSGPVRKGGCGCKKKSL